MFSSIWPIDRTLSGAATLGLSGPGNDGYKGVLLIPQSFSITRASPSDCLVSYPGHELEDSYRLCRDAVGVFYSPSRQGHAVLGLPELTRSLIFLETFGYCTLIICVLTLCAINVFSAASAGLWPRSNS